MTHVFVDDGEDWLDRIRRCRWGVGEHGEVCGLPEHNRMHDVPDMSKANQEHRRRVGEGDES